MLSLKVNRNRIKHCRVVGLKSNMEQLLRPGYYVYVYIFNKLAEIL